MTTTPDALQQVAREVGRAAAALIRERRTGEVTVADTKTSTIDIVTEVDRAAEELIRDDLARRRPEDGFLGEESGRSMGSTGIRWIVDPIDGTVNFYYDLVQYAVSIAAEQDGTVVAGTVINVVTGTEYSAALGCGAMRDETPIRVRKPVPLDRQLVITGFAYRPDVRAVQARAVASLLTRIRDLRRIGSSALDVCHVAEGAADAYFEEGVHLWDYAASALIAREAGARTEVVPGAGGMDLLMVAPEGGFDEFAQALREAGFAGE